MNLVDIAVIAVLLVSALIAFYRGFVREVLTVAAWIGAVLAAIYLYPMAKPRVREVFPEYPLIADVITVVAIFIVVLVLASVVSHLLTRNIRGSAFGGVDRSLGLIFGVARGAFLLCLAYLAMAWAMPDPRERPVWVAEARSLPLLESGAEYLKTLVPAAALDEGSRAASAARSQFEQVIDRQSGQRRQTGEPATDQAEDRSGYDADERSDLDRLIQGTQ